jgi:hypothetical protein
MTDEMVRGAVLAIKAFVLFIGYVLIQYINKLFDIFYKVLLILTGQEI